MIITGQLSREEGLKLLELPPYDELEMKDELNLILKNVGLTQEEFNEMMKAEPKQHMNYKTSSYNSFRNCVRKIVKKG